MNPNAARAGPLDLVTCGLLVLVASGAVLVLELACSRLLAPVVGVSLHTWTSIIGIALAGISLGSWLGGRVASRGVGRAYVPVLFAGSAVLTLLPLLWIRAAESWVALRSVPVLPRTFVLSVLVLGPSSTLLAMVTPLAVQRLIADVKSAGKTTGALYALGTLGGLVGNFLAGLVFLARLELSTIILIVAGALLACAALSVARPLSFGASDSAAPPAAGAVDGPLSRNPALGWLLVAIGSFHAFVVEVASSRLLAPHLGASLITWTCILGVVLAGIASGNYLGGVLADRLRSQTSLAGSLIAAAMLSLLVAPIHQALVNADAFSSFGLVGRTLTHTAVVFLAPVFALGTISPQVVRLSLTGAQDSGVTVGRLYAWSTLGALLGTFLTGWWLVRAVGVFALLLAGSCALLILAAVVGGARGNRKVFGGLAAAVALGAAFLSLGVYRSPCTEETDYFCITVYPMEYRGREVKAMRLDMLVHTLTDLKDPSFLGYPHNYVQADFVRYRASKKPDARVLVIGGGGYVVPRWIEAALPKVRIDVVEIDPEVTRVALEEFGVARDTKIRSFNLDGRLFVQERAERGVYDVVMLDAVNDLSVPYHLVTREHVEHVSRVMSADGVFLVTVIDDIPSGAFLRSVIRTMRAVFPNVELLREAQDPAKGQSTYVVAGSRVAIDVAELRSVVKEQTGHVRVEPFTSAEVDAYLAAGPAVVLTDSYAPVDNMLAELFLLRERKARERSAR